MNLLDFEYKINNEGIKVKHKKITYNGYCNQYNKTHKKLFMKHYDICPDNIHIYIKMILYQIKYNIEMYYILFGIIFIFT